jgi:quinol-cytochrome oxidoreductase complex cytochrome b subunit
MAQADLDLRDVERHGLPMICMRCGAAAVVTKTTKFAWHPPWVFLLVLGGLLPFLIVALILTQRATIDAPLCDRHRGHWTWRAVFTWGGLFTVCAVVWLLIMDVGDANLWEKWYYGWLWVGTGVLFLIWLVITCVLQATSIRPTEIASRRLTLTNVAPEFVAATTPDQDDWDYERQGRRPLPRRPVYDEGPDEQA